MFRINQFIIENYTNSFSSFSEFETKINEVIKDFGDEKSHVGMIGLPIWTTIFLLAQELKSFPRMTIQQLFSSRDIHGKESIEIFINMHKKSMKFKLIEKELIQCKEGLIYKKGDMFKVQISDFVESWEEEQSSKIFLNSSEVQGTYSTYNMVAFDSKEEVIKQINYTLVRR